MKKCSDRRSENIKFPVRLTKNEKKVTKFF